MRAAQWRNPSQRSGHRQTPVVGVGSAKRGRTLSGKSAAKKDR
jgi:hypothetical protein